MIIEQTYELLKKRYPDRLEKLLITDVRVGLHLTAVRLSDGSVGTSATLEDKSPFPHKSNRDLDDFSPLKIKGQKVISLLETSKESKLVSSLRNAVLNAISSELITQGNYTIIENCDPIDLIDLNSRKTITIVGAFQSYIRKIAGTANKLHVLELNENALQPEQKEFYVPAASFRELLPVSEIVIITGQTLVNQTIDDLLSCTKPGSQVIITGPSSSIIPDILFGNNVSIIGAIKINHPETLFDVVSEGGTGYHLFEYCAGKICILKNE